MTGRPRVSERLLDAAVIECLAKNATATAGELAEKFGTSISSMQRRLLRLHDTGRLNRQRLGLCMHYSIPRMVSA